MSARAIERLEAALGEAVGTEVALERPGDAAHGDYATNVAMRLAGARKQAPRAIAEQLVALAAALPDVDRAEIAGPGFVNLWLSRAWYRDALAEMLAAGASYGGGFARTKERVQVEMVSANPTGPVTVASARNGAYGDSVARLLEFAGHEVEREYYYNDAGAQMERFRASVEARRRGEEPPEDGYHGEYVAELAKLPDDPVPQMLRRIEETMERFRIHFDSWAKQSELETRLPEYLPRLDTYEKDGAVWARSSAYGDEDDRVLIRSESGTPTYRAADVVYLADKLDRGLDRAIYVLGADHHGTRNWYAAVARMLGYDPDRVEVLLYQLVHLTRGGETAKMSKRRGDVVFLDELLDEVGVDAARWYLVSRGHDQAIDIDVDLASEKSQKNPVYYVQYAHARIAGILRNAGDAAPSAEPPAELADGERDLIKRLAEFPAVMAEAAARRGPHAIPTYAIRLADDFHRFYHDHKVLGSDAEAFRLGLVTATKSVIARSLDLIGVEAPDTM
ncbi:MAG: arginyl-tRNA synthetase [Gaiellaceae bacterium]|jgi:arginyl-tRNA synthetase|nr:arginyl-tRNA synthetase [Gaiellaceae bacterium]